MQKILSYLYPNRVQILADLVGFNVEYTNVYQRNVKIYRGIDNTIEFDIKNADQKRIDLTTVDTIIGSIELNVMDASGNPLPNSPYTVTPTSLKGIATTTIPADDLAGFNNQFLKYSLIAYKTDLSQIPLYCDSKFGAVGTIELDGDAMPVIRPSRIFDTFTGEVDLQGIPIWHSSIIPAKFYEAVPTASLSFDIQVTGFVGTIWIEATTDMTSNKEAFLAAGKPFGSWTHLFTDGMFTGSIPYATSLAVGNYNYFRVSYQTPSISGLGATFIVTKENNEYQVAIKYGGTGYTKGSLIKVLGHQLGGVDGINDLMITVNGVYGASSTAISSSYTISEVVSVSWTGVASNNTGTYIVSGTNFSGIVDKIIVS